MLQEVQFPTWRDANLRAAFAEVGNRKHGFALAGVAAQFALDAQGRCADVRMAGIGFGPVPRRFRLCEEFLAGKPPSEAVFREAGRMATELNEGNSDMHADAAYRKAMAGVLTERALNRALNASENVVSMAKQTVEITLSVNGKRVSRAVNRVICWRIFSAMSLA